MNTGLSRTDTPNARQVHFPREMVSIILVCLVLSGCGWRRETRVEPLPIRETANVQTAKPAPIQKRSSSNMAPRTRKWQTVDEKVLFRPYSADFGDYNPPGVTFEDVTFSSADGTKLHGWFFPQENPRAYVLHCHGNGQNLSYYVHRMKELQQDYRVSVFIFDYRGYGKSEGRPTVPGALQDARAAAKWLANKAGIDPSDLIVIGQSLGGAVAVDLAADIQPRGLVLENTFSSFRDVADHHAKWASWMVPRGKLNSVAKIDDYHGPLLQCHGEEDRTVPFWSGEKLFQSANDPKIFVPMKGQGHNMPPNRKFRWAFDDFLETLNNASEESS